ncbi:pentapeptide repeat-containing protein [Nocardia sp. CA-128927]|uniref:pentapeptide repeat-containing protein n=1 Tax=Nocardia sp. CA-128927 TaxID=3239975 RepID=UPI003D9671D8
MRQPKRWLTTAAVIILIFTLAWLAYQGPLWLAGDAKNAESFRNQLIQLVGIGVTAAVAVYGIKKHYLDKDKQYTDSFSAAIGHLGSTDLTVRAGGVRELDRIMHFTPIDRIRVLDTCADFLRQHAGPRSRPDPDEDLPADVAAVLSVLQRRNPSVTEPPMNLAGVRLPRSNLRETTLTGVRLTAAELTDSDLRGATLIDADLTNADLVGADLTGANLTRARLTGARLIGAKLIGATLTGADLSNTALAGADLTSTVGITAAQLEQSRTSPDTQLP